MFKNSFKFAAFTKRTNSHLGNPLVKSEVEIKALAEGLRRSIHAKVFNRWLDGLDWRKPLLLMGCRPLASCLRVQNLGVILGW